MSDNKQLNARATTIRGELGAALAAETGDHRNAGSEVFEKNLPEGHTPETVKELDLYRVDFAAGALAAVGDVAVAAAAADPSKTTMSATIGMAAGEKLEVGYQHVKTGRVPGKEEGTEGSTYTKHGALTLTHRTRLGGKGGQIGTAFDIIREAAEAASKK